MKVKPSPYDTLQNFALEWIKKRFTSFTIEDLKNAFYGAGNAPPANSSAFGGMLQGFKRQGFIFDIGYTTAKRSNNKNKVIAIWISKEFKEKQSRNATRDQTIKMDFDS